MAHFFVFFLNRYEYSALRFRGHWTDGATSYRGTLWQLRRIIQFEWRRCCFFSLICTSSEWATGPVGQIYKGLGIILLTANLHATQYGIRRLFIALSEWGRSGPSATHLNRVLYVPLGLPNTRTLADERVTATVHKIYSRRIKIKKLISNRTEKKLVYPNPNVKTVKALNEIGLARN